MSLGMGINWWEYDENGNYILGIMGMSLGMGIN